jgi:hypothetical protein
VVVGFLVAASFFFSPFLRWVVSLFRGGGGAKLFGLIANGGLRGSVVAGDGAAEVVSV